MKRPYTDKQGQYLAVHLLLRQNPRVPTLGVRNATILPSLPAFRTPNDFDARNSWPYRANTGPGSIHPSADSARRATGLDLAGPSRHWYAPYRSSMRSTPDAY